MTDCAAVAILAGERFPCAGGHLPGGRHYFLADMGNPCPEEFCRLPNGHPGHDHDIPEGVVFVQEPVDLDSTIPGEE